MAQHDVLDDWEFDDDAHYLSENADNEVVGRYYAPLEAQMAAARLRSEGIACFLANQHSQTVLPHLQLVVRLHVRPTDAARARALLSEAALDSEPMRLRRPDRWVWVMLAILIGFLLAYLLVVAIRM